MGVTGDNQRATGWFESLESRRLMSATLLADVDPRTLGLTNAVLRPGADGEILTSDSGLFVTDGTAAGTRAVGAGFPQNPITTAVGAGGWMYTTERVLGGGYRLWATDGTAARTGPIATFGGQSSPYLRVSGNVLYLLSRSGSANSLYRVVGNGSPQLLGTFQGMTNPDGYDLQFVELGDRTYFLIDVEYDANASALWRTDGTAAGTELVRRVVQPNHLAASHGSLYFGGMDLITGRRAVWKSDGTADGTGVLGNPAAVVYPSDASDFTPGPDGRTVFRSGTSLFCTTGGAPFLPAAVALSVSVQLGSERAFTAGPGGYLYFAAERPGDTVGIELYRTDGTAAGTGLVADVRPADGNVGSKPGNFVAAGDRLFFVAHDGVRGRELFVTDGTAAGTRLTRDLFASTNELSPFNQIVQLGDRVLMLATSDLAGNELHVSDGTAEGTRVLIDLNTRPFSGNPGGAAELSVSSPGQESTARLGGFTYFGNPQGELWRTDGSPTGTARVAALTVSGSAATAVRWLTAAGDALYFVTEAVGVSGTVIWRSDGTAAGTVQLARVTGGGSSMGGIVATSTAVYITAGGRVYQTDGTAAGTRLWQTGVEVGGATIGERLVYGRTDADGDNEPWVTDGTAAGTLRLADLSPGTASSRPSLFVPASGGAYFTAQSGRALYRTDGTPAGTVLLADFGVAGVVRIAADGAGAYVLVNSTTTGLGLWRTDGTAAGTVRVATFPRLASYDNLWSDRDMVVAGGRVFFVAGDAATGAELWTSDGSVAGTRLVVDLNSGAAHGIRPIGTDTLSKYSTLLWADPLGGARVYFSGDDGSSGRELWTSDGTASGTFRLGDVNPGSASSEPRLLGAMVPPDQPGVPHAIFAATEPITSGRELFRAPVTPPDVTPPQAAASFVMAASPGWTFSFSEPVVGLASSAFTLTLRDTGAVIAIDPSWFAYNPTIRLATIRPPAAAFPEGRLRLRLAAAGIADAAGNPLPADVVADADAIRGDMNRDGSVNNLDIAPFVLGLTSPAAFADQFGFAPDWLGDANRDGAFNNLDIAPFVAQLTGAPTAPPATAPVGVRSARPRPVADVLGTTPLGSVQSEPQVTAGVLR
jgi:ELWxxDGT repeat protein